MLFNYFITLAAFGIIIFLHELGHYCVARFYGVGVAEFAVGMGPKLLSWKNKYGTNWVVCLLPIGGYIVPKEEKHKDVIGEVFENASPFRGILIALAGPVANFITAVLIMLGISIFFGQPVFTNKIKCLSNNSVAQGLLMPGDRVIKINNEKFLSFTSLVGKSGVVNFEIMRDNETLKLDIDKKNAKKFGIIFETNFSPISLFEAVKFSFSSVFKNIAALFGMIFNIFYSMNFHGPIGIIGGLSEAMQAGFVILLLSMVSLSIGLGVSNLLPIPVLDGGRILIFMLKATGIQPSKRVEELINYISYTILLFIILYSSYSDFKDVL